MFPSIIMSSVRKFAQIDASVAFSDSTDSSKELQFDLSGITAGTRRIFAIPDTNGTLVTDNSPSHITIDKTQGKTKSSSYYTSASWIYPGTSTITPTSIKVWACTDAGTAGQVRIYDFTNGNVISESSSYNNTSFAIIDTGTLSNLPSGESVFEVQIKRVSGKKKKIHIRNVTIFY